MLNVVFTPLCLLVGPEVHETLKHARLGMPLAGREKQRVPRGSPFSRKLSLAPSGTVRILYQQTWVKVPPSSWGCLSLLGTTLTALMTGLCQVFFQLLEKRFLPRGFSLQQGDRVWTQGHAGSEMEHRPPFLEKDVQMFFSGGDYNL